MQQKIQRIIVTLLVGVFGFPALAQNEPDPAELVQDFVHYVRIDQHELAADLGQQLLDSGLDARQFVALVEDALRGSEFTDAVIMARRPVNRPALRRIAQELDKLFEDGRRARARDPNEIARNINLLGGTLRQVIIGRERLVSAGEYAMPQLLSALVQSDNLVLRNGARRVMLQMGQQSVMPLVAALPELDAARQELVVNLISNIEYDTWLPFVYELGVQTELDNVRTACDRAIQVRLGNRSRSGDVGAWFYDLSERYYSENREVTAFPGEDFQLVWDFNPAIPGSGLAATAIRTEVYHEAMAMRLAARSLQHRPENNPAHALWLASNFSREVDSPDAYDNPLYPADEKEAMWFATFSGVDKCQWVLGRALDTSDTPLAMQAIGAIQRVAGAGDMQNPILFQDALGARDRRPLIEALSYPNRRVQYEAALALAKTQPEQNFAGAERVVPILSSAIRDASRQVGVVITPDDERAGVLRAILEGEGYETISGPSLAALQAPMNDLPGVDVILLDVSTDEVRPTIDGIRGDARLVATPVLALATGQNFEVVRRRLAANPMVGVRRSAISEEELRNSIRALVMEASGGTISSDEAGVYATRSLSAMRDLAIARNAVFDVADAALPLVATLGDTEGGVKFQVAEVLSWINQARVQVAMMESALDAGGIQRVQLLGHVENSAKRFGNLLDPRQVGRLIDVAINSNGTPTTIRAAVTEAVAILTVPIKRNTDAQQRRHSRRLKAAGTGTDSRCVGVFLKRIAELCWGHGQRIVRLQDSDAIITLGFCAFMWWAGGIENFLTKITGEHFWT